MPINEILINSITNQFTANEKINLFYEDLDFRNHFLEETKEVIHKYKWDILKMDQENQAGGWIEIMTEKAMQIFCNSNQFIDVRETHRSELRMVYITLWKEIVEELNADNINFDQLQKSHLTRLSNWVMKTNSFINDVNGTLSPGIPDVACYEYTGEFQVKLLSIDLQNIVEPVLDIGCGTNGNLVKYLRDLGVKAFGMDRLVDTNEYLFRSDWLDFDFKPQYWGTIISNLSFALHFTNHHSRKDGEYILYAQKYMDILHSLKRQGTFYYAPRLPFIEAYLPKESYKTTTQRISDEFSNTIVHCI